jgi:hypothetical protein
MILAHAVASDTDHVDANDVFIGSWETRSTRQPGSYLFIVFSSVITNPSKDFLPAICTVNTQLFQEVTTQYLHRRTFVLRNYVSVHFMETWLSNLHKGFRHIRALSLYDFDPISHTDKHCNFLARCEDLVRLSLRDCRVVYNTMRRYVDRPDELPALVVILRRLPRLRSIHHVESRNRMRRIIPINSHCAL